MKQWKRRKLIGQRKFITTGVIAFPFGNFVPYEYLQAAYERGLQGDSLEINVNPYHGAKAVAWLRGFYFSSTKSARPMLISKKTFSLPRQASKNEPHTFVSISDIGQASSIDGLGKAWGDHMRSAPNGWGRTNPIARLGDIGSGHSYVRATYSSDTITSEDQTSYSPTSKKGKLKLGENTWQISGCGLTSDSSSYRKNIFDMRINNMRVAKPKILIAKLMDDDVRWFHCAWHVRLQTNGTDLTSD